MTRWTAGALIGIGALLAAAPEPARAGTIRVEMEGFFEAHNIGGTAIQVKSCTAASARLAVDGLDVDGEWVRVRVTLPHDYCFVDSLRSAGDYGLRRTWAISVAPETPTVPVEADSVTTIPGLGIG